MIVKTVEAQIENMAFGIWQFDTSPILTASSPEVLDLIAVLQQANAQTPLLKLDVSATLNAPNGSVIVGYHYWIGQRVGDGEQSKAWSGRFIENLTGRKQIATLLEQWGVTNIDALWQ